MEEKVINNILTHLTQFIFKYDNLPMASNDHLESAVILLLENLPIYLLAKESKYLLDNSMVQEILENTAHIRTEKLRKLLEQDTV